jgi:hypothetical protein
MIEYYPNKHTNIPQIIDINAIIYGFFAFGEPVKLNQKDSKKMFFITYKNLFLMPNPLFVKLYNLII